jgi:spore maturation protein CgeB
LRILLAGNWRAEIHEPSLKRGFLANGCIVDEFKWNDYFRQDGRAVGDLIKKLQYKFLRGPAVRRINNDLVEIARKSLADLIFLYRPNLISATAVKAIKQALPASMVVCYNNDDPFSELYPGYTWATFKRAIPAYDLVFSYRPGNVENYYLAGARKVKMLPPWYDPELSHPVSLDQQEVQTYSSDIVFIGHYEADGRIDIIRRLVKEGHKVSLYGPEWNKHIVNDPELSSFYPVRYLHGEEYNKALCGSRMALVLYSSLNNDVYTRRCFEIPATGTLMIAQRNSIMEKLYTEDEEAVYFDSMDDLCEKVRQLLDDREKADKIAAAGCRRASISGYDVTSRARDILTSLH